MTLLDWRSSGLTKGSESAEGTPDVESFMVHCHLELRLRIMHMLRIDAKTISQIG